MLTVVDLLLIRNGHINSLNVGTSLALHYCLVQNDTVQSMPIPPASVAVVRKWSDNPRPGFAGKVEAMVNKAVYGKYGCWQILKTFPISGARRPFA